MPNATLPTTLDATTHVTPIATPLAMLNTMTNTTLKIMGEARTDQLIGTPISRKLAFTVSGVTTVNTNPCRRN
jgi:hypothetical protein